MATARGTPTLATVMVTVYNTLKGASAARSGLLSVSAKRGMSMINQQIHVSLVAANINIPVPVVPM